MAGSGAPATETTAAFTGLAATVSAGSCGAAALAPTPGPLPVAGPAAPPAAPPGMGTYALPMHRPIADVASTAPGREYAVLGLTSDLAA